MAPSPSRAIPLWHLTPPHMRCRVPALQALDRPCLSSALATPSSRLASRGRASQPNPVQIHARHAQSMSMSMHARTHVRSFCRETTRQNGARGSDGNRDKVSEVRAPAGSLPDTGIFARTQLPKLADFHCKRDILLGDVHGTLQAGRNRCMCNHVFCLQGLDSGVWTVLKLAISGLDSQ